MMLTTLIRTLTSTPLFKQLPLLLAIGCFLAIAGGCSKTSDTDYIEKALQQQDKGNLQAAVIELKNALQQNPKNNEARVMLGKLYVRLGDGAAAQKELEIAKEGGIPYEVVAIPLGEAYLLQLDFKQALANIWPREEIRPEVKAELLTLRGRAYQLQGDLDEADKAFKDALARQSRQVKALVGLGRNALQRNRREETKQWLDKAQAAAPNNAEVWRLQGDYEQLQANWPAAEAAFNKVLALDAKNLAARIGLVAVLVSQNKMDEAGKALAAVQGKNRNHVMVLYYLALLDFNQKNYAQAEGRLQELFRRSSGYRPALYLMGLTQYALGHLEQADTAAQQLLQQSPNSAEAQKLKALVELKKDSLEPGKRQAIIDYLVSQFPQDPQILNAVAAALQTQGKLAEATGYLRKVAELKPDSAEARANLGEALLAQNKPEQAVPELEKSKQLGAQSQDTDLLLIVNYLKAKDFDRALATLQPLLEKEPRNVTLWNIAGVAYAGKKQFDKAQAALQKAWELAPGDPNTTGNLVQLALEQNDAGKARGYYRQALEKHPDDLRLLLGLAELEQRSGNKEAYAKRLDEAVQKQPEAWQPRVLRARLYLAERKPEQALALLQPVQDKQGSNPDFLQALGSAYILSGNTNAAIQRFKKLADLQPTNAQAQYSLAGAYGRAGDFKGMQEALFKGLTLQPDYPQVATLMTRLLQLAPNDKETNRILQLLRDKLPKSRPLFLAEGRVAEQGKDYKRALTVYQQALAQFPEDADLTRNLAGVYLNLDNPKASINTLQTWLEKHPKDIETQFLLANYYLRLKRYDEAKAAFSKVLTLDPANSSALNNLAWTSLQTQDIPQARQYADKALTLAPNSAAAMDTLALILLEQNETQRALELLRKAVQQQPKNPGIRYHLAKALVKDGQRDEARQILRSLLADQSAFDSRQEAEALLKELGD